MSPLPASESEPAEQPGYQLVHIQGELWALGKGTAPNLFYDRSQNVWESEGEGLPRDLGANPLVVSQDGMPPVVALARDGSQAPLYLSETDWSDLPALPEFTAESATIQDGHVYVSGTSPSGARQVMALKLESPSDGWKQLPAPAAAYIVFDRSSVLVAPTTSDSLQKARIDLAPLLPGLGVANVGLGQANLGRLQELAGLLLDGLASEPTLKAAAVKDVLDVLMTLKQQNALNQGLRERADAVFLERDLTPESASLLGEEWYGRWETTGEWLSTVDPPRVDSLRDRAVLHQPMRRSDLLHLLAASRVLADPIPLLESLPVALIAPKDARLLDAELTRGLARSIDALLRAPTQSLTQVQSILERAKRLSSDDARTAFIHLQVRRLLILGKPSAEALSALRSYLAEVPPSSEAELRLAVAWFQREGGGIAARELRALAALTDSDGARTPGERAVLESLDWRRLSPGARAHLPTLTRGVTRPEDLAGGEASSGLGEYKVDGTGPLAVWAAENRRSSEERVVHVGITPTINAGPDGLKTDTVHVTGTTVLPSAEGQEPFPTPGALVTADGFDQVQALWTANHVLERLAKVGVDVSQLLRGAPNGGKVRIKVNDYADDNAFYSSAQNVLSFGTANESWHLASDSDIVAHEMGHYVLDHLNPNLNGQDGEGPAIHEGFADALAAMLFADPELAEDWGRTDDPEGALRSSKNRLKLSEVSPECHDRGQVYAGFLWSTWERLGELIQDEAQAHDWMIGILATHPLFYVSSTVTSADFVAAMMNGAAAFLDRRVPGPTIEALQAAMKAEAVARDLVDPTWTLPAGAGMAAAPALARALRQDVGVFAPLDAKELLSRIEGYRPRPDVTHEIIGEQVVNRLRKFTVQAKAVDGASGRVYPIEDGFVTATYDGSRLVELGGRGRFLPSAFDFTEPPFGAAEATSRAKDYARTLFQARATSAKVGSYVLNHLDRIFGAPTVRVEDVVSRGLRARKVITEAGEFIVGSDGAIEASRVGHHD